MYRDQYGEFVSGYWGLKGYKYNQSITSSSPPLTNPIFHEYRYQHPPHYLHLNLGLETNSSGILPEILQLYWLNLTPCLLMSQTAMKGMGY